MLGSKAGVDPGRILDVLGGGLAANKVMEVRRRNFLEHDFTPGFRIDLHHKDLNIALESGDAYGVPLPVTGTVLQRMRALRARGHGGDDHSGLLQLAEELAAHRIGEPGGLRAPAVALPARSIEPARSSVVAATARRAGASMPVTSASSTTAPMIAASSSGLPASRSCSVEVLCSPTRSAPASRRSIEICGVGADARGRRRASRPSCRATSLRRRLVPADPRHRRPRQRAERVERRVAHQLDPDLVAQVLLDVDT